MFRGPRYYDVGFWPVLVVLDSEYLNWTETPEESKCPSPRSWRSGILDPGQN